jgi:hypothetical protein
MGRTYAIVWVDGDPVRRSGTLRVDRGAVRLDGGAPGGRGTVQTIRAGDIVEVSLAREPAERLNENPTIVLTLADGERLRLGSMEGLGAVRELHTLLAQLARGPRA